MSSARPAPFRFETKRAILGLGITQITGWGATYYLLPLLARPIGAELEMSSPAVFGGLSLTLACSAVFGPWIGRWQDSAGSRAVMSAGSVITALGLCLLGFAQGPLSFYLAWFVIGLASPMVLYSAAFTALTQIAGDQARRAISYLTFLGGLASTLFWPLSSWLLTFMTWRQIAFTYAALQLVICLPIHWRLLTGVDREGKPHAPAPPVEPGLPSEARPLAFALLSMMLTLNGLIVNAFALLLFPVMAALGFSQGAAVLAGSTFGLAQVAARITEMMSSGRISALMTGMISALTLPLAYVALAVSGGETAFGLAAAIFYGVSNGLMTIARGAIVLAIYGTYGYGERINRIAVGQNIAGAIGPVLAGFLLDTTSALTLVNLMLATALASAALMVALKSHCARHGLT